MLGNLLNVLIELLPVNANQLPIRIGRMTVQRSGGAIAKVFIVPSSSVVWVNVLRGILREMN